MSTIMVIKNSTIVLSMANSNVRYRIVEKHEQSLIDSNEFVINKTKGKKGKINGTFRYREKCEEAIIRFEENRKKNIHL